jgi:hypothetical protein
MADLRGHYDSEAEPSSGFEVLPAGTYTVKITGGDWKNSNAKDEYGNLKGGRYLQIDMEVVDGPHQGSVIVDRFNLDNPSREAVRIANSQFAALRKAVGIPNPKDTADMVGPRFQLALKCEKRRDDPDKMTNRVQRYVEKGQAATAPRQNTDDAPYRNAPRAAPKPEPAESEVPF